MKEDEVNQVIQNTCSRKNTQNVAAAYQKRLILFTQHLLVLLFFCGIIIIKLYILIKNEKR